MRLALVAREMGVIAIECAFPDGGPHTPHEKPCVIRAGLHIP